MPLSVQNIFQIADRYCDSALLQHAHAAGVFDLLRCPHSARDVARAHGWIEPKTAIFLNALAALGLVEKDGSMYRNSNAATAVLAKDSPGYIGDLIEHERLQWNLWGRMGEVLTSREAIAGQQDLTLPANDDANTVFHRAMMQLAGELLDVVTSLPEWDGVRHGLDLAGGHGLYLATLARRYPELTGEVWDAASARRHAESIFAAHGVADRVTFVVRDIADPRSFAGVSADAVMLNHCLHHFAWEDVQTVARCVAGILPTGGIVTVLDVHLDGDRIAPAENALFSLYMMMNTVRGQVHPTEDLVAVLRASGFTVKERLLESLEGDVLLVGRKL